jgi:peptidyl-prolyl cis-trans isomerase NIMA-interacting 1
MGKPLRGVLPAVFVLACWGCGAGQTGLDQPAAGKGTPGERCLATANAPHDHKATEPSKLLIKHILVAYKGAKAAPADVARTRMQACLRAASARDEIRGGKEFDEVAGRMSDDKETLRHNVQREDVLPQFADAAFELDVFQLSEVVETEEGFHVILRME